jgi:pantoate--beta-alanine ligase
MKELSRQARAGGLKVVLVPTMGYLHEGHMALIEKAGAIGDFTVVSIFVNPSQFSVGEDFRTYPRDLEGDLKAARGAGVDVLFHPPAGGEMYREGSQTFVEVAELGKGLCGPSRPGHFRGVATVVMKLFNIVRPDKAVFGLKDYQQFLIIRRMVEDMDMDVELVPLETVREADGLAMSSRNAYLEPAERNAARAIPVSLDAARRAFSGGERRSGKVVEKVKKIIENEPLAVIDYIKVCDPETLGDVETIGDRALLALAVKVGATRLIDNCMLS